MTAASNDRTDARIERRTRRRRRTAAAPAPPLIPTAEEFVWLRTSPFREDHDRAGREPATLDTWRDVVARFPDMREWVAYNKTVPVEILAELATDPDPRVRRTVAEKRKLPPETMLRMTRDPDEDIRASLIGHPKVTPEVLAALADDPSHWVRWHLAQHLAAAAGEPVEESYPGGPDEPTEEERRFWLPGDTTASALDPDESARLTAAWDRQWPGVPLVGHELRDRLPHHWVRFHAVPEHVWGLNSASAVGETRRRRRATIEALGGDDPWLLVLTTTWSDVPTDPVPERGWGLPELLPHSRRWVSTTVEREDEDGGSFVLHVFVDRLHRDDPALETVLRQVADGVIPDDVVLAATDLHWLIWPYGRGQDVFAPSPAARDALRERFAGWLSPSPHDY